MEGSEMAQQVKTVCVNPDDQSSVPRINMVEGMNQIP